MGGNGFVGSADASEDRRAWLSVLAKARPDEARRAWTELDVRPAYQALRNPEIGLVMVRGRMGGAGDPFNLGEMTVTRSAVRLSSGETGVGYVAGRDKLHAEIAAAVDAMLQSPTLHDGAYRQVIQPLLEAQTRRREAAGRKVAATRVEFFTMVRDRKPQA